MTEPPTIQFEEVVHHGSVPLDDPAETYHEASRLYPSTASAQLPGLVLVSTDPVAHASTSRSSRRDPARPAIELPRPHLPRSRFDRILRARSSRSPDETRPLSLGAVSALLAASYRASRTERGVRRPVPSAGALYPLELYAVCSAVDGAPAELLHYDPFGHRLELRGGSDGVATLLDTVSDPAAIERAALFLVVTAVPWRARFKYGARGYRFALLEAGHVAQNVLLAAAALGLTALPVGGFYDRRLDDVVGANGVDELSLYLLAIGGSR